MKSRVALVDIKKHKENSISEALKLIGGIPDINKAKQEVILKVGVYSPGSDHHTTIDISNQIINAFDRVKTIYLTESDSYKGTGSERLLIWKKLFSEKVIPYNISEDKDTQPVKINTEIMDLTLDMPKILFKPRVFVTTHVLRTYNKGSVLKNLFGLVPIVKKAKFHKNAIFNTLLPDITEAIGGIDLAVLDGTYLHSGLATPVKLKTDILIVGRDAVAVETVGYMLLGINPKKLETIQSFARRGLGIAEFGDIEIVGASFDDMKDRIKKALKEAESMKEEKPRKWSPSRAASILIRNGFFKLPNKRTLDDVITQMELDDSNVTGRRSEILAALRRRIKLKMLQGQKEETGWIFWTE